MTATLEKPIPETPSELSHSKNSGKFAFNVNDRVIHSADPVLTGREILSKGGFEKVDSYALIKFEHPGTSSVGLEDRVDLREPGVEKFRAFESDRVFRFTLNQRGYEWGAATISGAELRDAGAVSDDEAILLDREHQADEVIQNNDEVNLGQKGGERLRTRPRLVTVLYNHQPFKLEAGNYSTEQLKAVFHVPPGYVLDEIKHDGEFQELKPHETVHVKEGLEFISHAPCGQSS